jgi:hypothetical protein
VAHVDSLHCHLWPTQSNGAVVTGLIGALVPTAAAGACAAKGFAGLGI